MTAPRPIHGLSEISDRYDVLLCDVWGVIHNGREHFPDACAALARFRDERGPVVLISNSPKPRPAVVEQMDSLGVPRAAWSALVTSGDATRALLGARAPGPAWAIGPERDGVLYEGLGLEFAGPEAAAFIACTGPYDDEVETPEDYRDRLAAAAARGLEMVCANPDIVVQRGDKLVYCGGALAQLYEALGGTVFMAGKPHPPIYDLSVAEAARLAGGPVARERILCVGDGMATDVMGANAQALDVLFIASGIHGADAVGEGGLDAAAVETLLAENGASAAWAAAHLVW
ncbi:TIGR01459 family HAD-type hydrolase [Phenylobacterium sp.]|uniref:TIGR01459 family HAD-type hydrolase n=1 Tax=Phenylobacterium sp. TaxID=1871053 RepID=UPI0035B33970